MATYPSPLYIKPWDYPLIESVNDTGMEASRVVHDTGMGTSRVVHDTGIDKHLVSSMSFEMIKYLAIFLFQRSAKWTPPSPIHFPKNSGFRTFLRDLVGSIWVPAKKGKLPKVSQCNEYHHSPQFPRWCTGIPCSV